MKNKQAEIRIKYELGYNIEWCVSPRGNQLCKAIKEGHKTVYAKTLINLEKEILKLYN